MQPELQIRLLGEFSVAAGGEPVTTINTPRLQALLAYLILHRHAPQPRQHIAFLFWPNSSEEQAHSNLRNLLMSLRRVFPHADNYISIDGRTLQWRSDSAVIVDFVEFERAFARAEEALVATKASPGSSGGSSPGAPRMLVVSDASGALREAVDLYAGDLLPACYDEWILTPRERLRQSYLQALTALVAALEREGNIHSAILYAQLILRNDPLQEENYRRLMRLHLLEADRAGVVSAYRKCERVLRRELQIEPSAATLELLRRAEEIPGPQVGGRRMRRAGKDQPPLPGNLPAQTTQFIGRERQVVEIAERLLQRECRLVTLTGTAGIGKTRLALEVASGLKHFADGVYFVPLAPLTEPEMVERAIAQTLRVTETTARPLWDNLIEHLRDKQLLLLLDNFEHILPAASLVSELLASCRHLKALTTSRAPLNLRGEREYLVPPLTTPGAALPLDPDALRQSEAVALFVERAHEVSSSFALTKETARPVAEICRRLEGLPLAIELAAAQLKVLSPDAILSRLDRRLKLLVRGKADLPHRQRTLEAAIEWSYNLLAVEEQLLFRQLGVFVGGCTIEAAAAVCDLSEHAKGESHDIETSLTSLVDTSMLKVQIESDLSRQQDSRFEMLETIREYAQKKLAESGAEREVSKRHSAFYIGLVAKEAQSMEFVTSARWLEQVETEYGNFRAALDWALEHGMADDAAALGIGLGRFWFVRGHALEGARWLDLVLAKSDRLSAPLRIRALAMAGALADAAGDFAKSGTLQEEGLALSREMGDAAAIADALRFLAFGSLLRGNLERAESAIREALPLYESLNFEVGVSASIFVLAVITKYQGDADTARRYYDASLPAIRERKDDQGTLIGLALFGYALLSQGEYGEAEALLKEGLLRSRQLGDKRNLADCMIGLAVITGERDDAITAAQLFGAAQALLNEADAALWPLHRPQYERAAARVQAQLGQSQFEAAFRFGLSMTPEQATELAQNSP